jgi:hypothetical protein
MKANLLAGIQELNSALRRYMVYVMGFKWEDCQVMLFGAGSGLSRESLEADFWLIEAWHPFEPDNPEGFRTAYKLAGKMKCLLLFLKVPEGFPEEGPFWCSLVTTKLSDKINEVLDKPSPSKADFDNLIAIWPALALEPSEHHHYHQSRTV